MSTPTPPVPPIPLNPAIDQAIAQSYMSGWAYNSGVPYTGDANRSINPIGTPTWLVRGSLHRAKFSQLGPYQDPNGLFEVPTGYALVYWEVKQGTPQWQPLPADARPVIFAILQLNDIFVSIGSLMHNYVNPDLTMVLPGDDIAVWFSMSRPADIVGMFRPVSNVDLGFGRDNSGGIGRQ